MRMVPGRRPEEADYLVDERGLAGTVVPEQAEDLRLADGEADAVIRPGPRFARPRRAPVHLGQLFDLQQHPSFPLVHGPHCSGRQSMCPIDPHSGNTYPSRVPTDTRSSVSGNGWRPSRRSTR